MQTNKNQIEFYDLSTQEFIGFIPAYNSTFLTTFAFNSDNTSILIGHQDGSIYRFEIDTVFLEPNEIAEFEITNLENDIEAIEYCNIHGLWRNNND